MVGGNEVTELANSTVPQVWCDCGLYRLFPETGILTMVENGIAHTSDRCVNPDQTEQTQLDRIEAMVKSMLEAHNDVVEKVNRLMTEVAPHLADIGPMLDALAESSIFRMVTGVKKNRRDN